MNLLKLFPLTDETGKDWPHDDLDPEWVPEIRINKLAKTGWGDVYSVHYTGAKGLFLKGRATEQDIKKCFPNFDPF